MAKTVVQYIDRLLKLLEPLHNELHGRESGASVPSTNDKAGAPGHVNLIEQLQQWRQSWQKDDYLLGVLGVTSAGKSTVINALMAQELLVSRVKPSSNTIVKCAKGSPLRFEVHFANKPPVIKEFDNSQSLTEFSNMLKAYSDESLNQNNQEEVDSINIFSPDFHLDANITIADTPGLDAFRYEAHEELTWRFLLPSVDLVLFISTAKANADSSIQKYLSIINENETPAIMVLNMKDSVVPKLGLGGNVLESSEEVLQKHIRRLRNTALSVYTESSKLPPIAPFSATMALNRHPESGLPQLLDLIHDHINRHKPVQEKTRLKRLYNAVQTVLRDPQMQEIEDAHEQTQSDALAVDYQQLQIEIQARRQQYRQGLDTLESTTFQFLKSKLELLHAYASPRQHGGNIFAAFAALNSASSKLSKDKAQALNDEVKSFSEGRFKQLSSQVGSIAAWVPQAARRMNIQHQDLREIMRDEKFAPSYKKADVQLREERHIRTYEQKQKGGWGFIKRVVTFGKCGYETVTEEYYEFDQRRFIEDMAKRLASLEQDFGEGVSNARTIVDGWLQRLQDNAQQQQDVIESAEAMRQLLQTQKQLLADLGQLLEQIRQDADIEIPASKLVTPAYSPPARAVYETTSVAYSLACLGNRVASQAHLAARNYCLQKVSGISDILLLGWDGASMEQFLQRFWHDYQLGELLLQEYEQTGDLSEPLSCSFSVTGSRFRHNMPLLHMVMGGHGGVPGLRELKHADNKTAPRRLLSKIVNKAKRLSPKPYIFLLAENIQVGQFEKMLATHPELLEYLQQSQGMVLCLQSGQVYRTHNSGSIDADVFNESLVALKDGLIKSFKLSNITSVLINDYDIGLSAMADYLFHNPIHTLGESNKAFEQLCGLVSDDNVLEKIIKCNYQYHQAM